MNLPAMPAVNLPTPRTDARIIVTEGGGGDCAPWREEHVPADFARGLERESPTHLQTIGRLRGLLKEAAQLLEFLPGEYIHKDTGNSITYSPDETLAKIRGELMTLPQSPDLRAKLAETVAMYEGKADVELALRDSPTYGGDNAKRRERHESVAHAYRSVAQHLKGLLA